MDTLRPEVNPGERLAHLQTKGGGFRLRDRARFRLSGPDAARYLNGQVTRDVQRLSGGGTACLLSPKGKLVSLVWILPESGGFLVDAPGELASEVGARLERYLIADDATLEDVSSGDPGWHVFGGTSQGGVLRIGLPGEDVPELPEGVLEATPEEIELLRIRQGMPVWGRELTPDTLVQEARLERFAVDFDKGCYVGQEVVSRLKSVGRVNRRLALLRGACEAQAGSQLLVDGATAGEITSSAFDFELSQTVALGYVLRTFEGAGSFRVCDATGKETGSLEQCDFPN